MLKKLFTAIGIVVLVIASISVYHAVFVPKTGYIEITKVFERFKMKEELAKKFKQTHDSRKKILDSLSFDLQLAMQKLKDKQDDKELMMRFDQERQDFLKKKQTFEEDNANLSAQYDKQILEQMSQYIIDFGKENSYDMIYGADGNGGLMYARDQLNLSEQVVQYINDKYEGVK